MFGTLPAAAVSLTLALSPYTVVSSVAPEADPSWDEPTPEAEQPVEEPDESWEEESEPVQEAPTEVPPPVVTAPPAAVPTRPPPKPPVKKGLGLIIAASITGGAAWLLTVGKVVALRSCTRAIENDEIDATAYNCFFKAGLGITVATVVGWPMNWATWGLATGAGVVRGRYDGINMAYDGSPKRNVNAFIGSGAALLTLGVIGRIATFATFGTAIDKCIEGASECQTSLSVHFVGTQFASASIAAGGGLLGYGLSYRSAKNKYDHYLKTAAPPTATFRILPSANSHYTGLTLAGQF